MVQISCYQVSGGSKVLVSEDTNTPSAGGSSSISEAEKKEQLTGSAAPAVVNSLSAGADARKTSELAKVPSAAVFVHAHLLLC